ncbi:MAG TPA: universal stress protein [Terriglobia bacterium]|nr:universal stress protein [Terriglobia bacterium]
MLKIERILCPTDFSDFSERAFEYGLSLARHYKAELYLLHVVRPVIIGYPEYAIPDSVNEFYGELREHAEEQLREFAKVHAEGGVQAMVAVEEGVATESILDFAREHSVDMIVMGTHGRRGFQRLTLGSVTERVLRKAGCPVLAVRRPAHDFVIPGSKGEPVHLRKIMLCSDFSECSDRALGYALSLAAEYKSELSMVHVLEHLPAPEQREVENARVVHLLEGKVPEDARGCCTIKTIVRAGKPYEEIVKLAEDNQTDLIVVGIRGRNVLDLALFGSTTHRVLQLGPCPVLAIHA